MDWEPAHGGYDRFGYWDPAHGEHDCSEHFEHFRLDRSYYALLFDRARWERPENVIKMIEVSM